ncbi:MAG: hypothetical protein WAV00_06800 [Nocardioides sp.]
MTTDLDSFEARLLDDLRAHVSGRTQPVPHASASARRWRRSLTLVGVAAAAAITLAIVLPASRNSPAYAVSDGPNGTIDVQVNSLEDAAGLQADLQRHGVRSQVLYLGNNMKCSPGQYKPAQTAPDSATEFSIGERISVSLDRRDLGPDTTVVISASRIPGGVYAEVGIAAGPVRACDPVPNSDPKP